jgi:hypothetical protein
MVSFSNSFDPRCLPNPEITLALPNLFQEKTAKLSQKVGIINHLSPLYTILK